MAHLDDTDNANLYSTSSAPGESDTYPFLSQTTTTEEPNGTPPTFTDGWSMVNTQITVGSPRSLRDVSPQIQ